jgi:hypothetical protein
MPLWALLTIGAAAHAREPALADFSLTGYVAECREELDRLLGFVREIGAFSPDSMRVFEQQGGWADGTEWTSDEVSALLLMYSGCLEEFPPNLLDESVVRRMIEAATDLQLPTLLHALVGVAIHRQPGPGTAVPLITKVVLMAGTLSKVGAGRMLQDTVRLWRVAFLPTTLRPDSATPAEIRSILGTYATALETALN